MEPPPLLVVHLLLTRVAAVAPHFCKQLALAGLVAAGMVVNIRTARKQPAGQQIQAAAVVVAIHCLRQAVLASSSSSTQYLHRLYLNSLLAGCGLAQQV
jgi:hypothetical protein